MPMKMVNIGPGRALSFASSGQGAPAVVLETGLGAESAVWQRVEERVAECTRVCRYDRAGRGSSPAVQGPRTASELVDDLRKLLIAAEIAPPYVLVGHSFGGLLVRLYAQRYPSDMAGLALVDSLHEDQFSIFGRMFPPAAPGEPSELTRARDFWAGGWRSSSSTVECLDLPASLEQGRAIESLGALPLHVVAAGTFANQPLLPAQQRPAFQQRWEAMQRQFLRLSSNSAYTLAPESGHFVQRDAPEAVVSAIFSILSQLPQSNVGGAAGRLRRKVADTGAGAG
jgi:pimeloyl-ACP methyl ester carboxylesterase